MFTLCRRLPALTPTMETTLITIKLPEACKYVTPIAILAWSRDLRGMTKRQLELELDDAWLTKCTARARLHNDKTSWNKYDFRHAEVYYTMVKAYHQAAE